MLLFRFRMEFKRLTGRGLTVAKQRTALQPDIVPRNRLHLPRRNLFEAASDFLLPDSLRIFIDGSVQTLYQTPGRIGSFLVGRARAFLTNS
jgi:hypothetical protein